jgi:hypothetical protein
MTPHLDLALIELFLRYWDDALTPAEADELEQRLAADPTAREWFQAITRQAVAAVDIRATSLGSEQPGPDSPTQPGPTGADTAGEELSEWIFAQRKREREDRLRRLRHLRPARSAPSRPSRPP